MPIQLLVTPMALDHVEFPSSVVSFNNEWLQQLLQTALNSQGHYSARARAVIEGHEPYATLAPQLDASSTQTVQPRRKHGRPPGSGTSATADDCGQTVRPIIQGLCNEGVYPSQQRVAALLPQKTTARQIRTWLYDFNIPWNDLLNSG